MVLKVYIRSREHITIYNYVIFFNISVDTNTPLKKTLLNSAGRENIICKINRNGIESPLNAWRILIKTIFLKYLGSKEYILPR